MRGRPEPAHPYLDHAGVLAFAHRGGTSHFPENTIEAFDHAVSLGYRYLETDVHLSADGVLVAFHDPDLSRTCDRSGRISDMTWSEIAQARVGGVAAIPRLDELLSAFPESRFNIDCKSDDAVEPLAAALRAAKCLDRVCIGSFSGRRLRRLRSEFGADLCTSCSPGEVTSLVMGRVPSGVEAAQVPMRQGPIPVVTRSFVERAHRGGLQVHVWTIDEPTDMTRLLDLGVDGIMTDACTVLRDVLVARGQWTTL